MFTTLKRLSTLFWILSIISIILTFIAGYVLFQTAVRDAGLLLLYFWLCLLFVPLALIGVAVTLSKIANELNDESSHIRERLKSLENR